MAFGVAQNHSAAHEPFPVLPTGLPDVSPSSAGVLSAGLLAALVLLGLSRDALPRDLQLPCLDELCLAQGREQPL